MSPSLKLSEEDEKADETFPVRGPRVIAQLSRRQTLPRVGIPPYSSPSEAARPLGLATAKVVQINVKLCPTSSEVTGERSGIRILCRFSKCEGNIHLRALDLVFSPKEGSVEAWMGYLSDLGGPG